MSGRSGKEISREYLDKVQSYLDSGQQFPLSATGAVNFSALAEQIGIPRQSLYKNPAIRELLGTAVAASVWAPPDSPERPEDADEGAIASQRHAADSAKKREQSLERRINHLEQQNAALVAENAELRRQLKALRLQHGREDMVIETGRRIPTPVGHG